MAVGRHRRETAVLLGRKEVVDRRGNVHVVPDESRQWVVGCAQKSVRSNRAELKGQLTNEVVVLLIDATTQRHEPLPDIGPWTIIRFRGRDYDVTAPPFLKRGTRRTTHWECEVRPRPPSNLEGVVCGQATQDADNGGGPQS